MCSLQVLLKSTQMTTMCKLPIDPTQIRVVLWVKTFQTCNYPITQLSLGTRYGSRVGSELLHSSEREEESGNPHSAHGKCFLGVVCPTSIP